jgi:nitroreductase
MMELPEVMRSAAGIRKYRPESVPDEVIARVLDQARFAPSGLNRQAWRVVVVRSAQQRARVGEHYSRVWQSLVDERVSLGQWTPDDPGVQTGTKFAQSFGQVPIQFTIWGDLSNIEVIDIDQPHPSLVAGGSVFPFVQNLILACRNEGVGTRLTTLLTRDPQPIREILKVPEWLSLATVVAAGYPVKWPSALARAQVESFASWDSFDGEPVTVPDPD